MRIYKGTIVLIIFFAGILINPVYTENVQDNRIRFQWAFVYSRTSGEKGVIDPVKKVTELEAGDRFRIYLKPVHNAYIYLLLHDTQGELSLIFPKSTQFFKKEYIIGRRYYLPDKDTWFRLDEAAGTEEFHLIVSPTPMVNLENLIRRYLSLAKSPDNKKRQDALMDVLDEVRDIKKQHSMFAGHIEKPIPIAGDPKGIEEEGEVLYGIEIEVSTIYAKTIRLSH